MIEYGKPGIDIATTTHIATSTSYPSSDTSIIKGRKRALREAYNRSLTAKHSYGGNKLLVVPILLSPILQDY